MLQLLMMMKIDDDDVAEALKVLRTKAFEDMQENLSELSAMSV